jgi:hypothetical protein
MAILLLKYDAPYSLLRINSLAYYAFKINFSNVFSNKSYTVRPRVAAATAILNTYYLQLMALAIGLSIFTSSLPVLLSGVSPLIIDISLSETSLRFLICLKLEGLTSFIIIL